MELPDVDDNAAARVPSGAEDVALPVFGRRVGDRVEADDVTLTLALLDDPARDDARRERVPLTALAITAVAIVAYLAFSGHSAPLAPVARISDRPIASVPWEAEVGHASSTGPSPLSLMSGMVFEDASESIGASLYEGVAGQSDARNATIDGSSIDAMVNSINAITQSLPETEARAFQKAVRVVMVANLPLEQLRAQNTPIEKVSEQVLIAGAQQELAGKTPLQVLFAAQGKIEAVKASRAARSSASTSGGSTPVAR